MLMCPLDRLMLQPVVVVVAVVVVVVVENTK